MNGMCEVDIHGEHHAIAPSRQAPTRHIGWDGVHLLRIRSPDEMRSYSVFKMTNLKAVSLIDERDAVDEWSDSTSSSSGWEVMPM